MQLSRRVLLGWLALGAASMAAGCAASVQAKPAQEPEEPPLKVPPQLDLVTGVDLQWVLVSQLQELTQTPAFKAPIEKLFPSTRLSVFQRMTGIDLHQVRKALVASYPKSTLFLLDGVAAPLEAEMRYRDRLMSDVVRSVYRHDALLVRGKTAQGEKRALGVLGDQMVALESGDSKHVRIALLYALQKLQKTPRAMQVADLSSLAKQLGPAPLLAFAPGPFEGEWNRALHGLLGVCTAVGASIQVVREKVLRANFLLAGSWGQDASKAAERLRASWDLLADSSMGRLMGLDQPVSASMTSANPETIGLSVEVDGVRVLQGLHAAVAAEVRDIMNL